MNGNESFAMQKFLWNIDIEMLWQQFCLIGNCLMENWKF